MKRSDLAMLPGAASSSSNLRVDLLPCFVVLVLVATLVSSADCRKADKAPSTERAETTPTPSTDVSPSEPTLIGIWTVVGHRIPGISAMTDGEAAAWHGQTVQLTVTDAISDGRHCDKPEYVTHSVARDSFLGTEFNLPPGSLPQLASLEHLTLLEVSCGDARWAALGGLLIQVDANHALSPWDGVFFELER